MRLFFLCSQTNDSKLCGFLPVVAKIFRRLSEGAAEGGCGGNSAAPERSRPAACSVRSRSQQKSFLFLLEEKNRRAQNKKCEENYFAGWRALASGGGANQPFRSKKVRAKCKISPQQKRPYWAVLKSFCICAIKSFGSLNFFGNRKYLPVITVMFLP